MSPISKFCLKHKNCHQHPLVTNIYVAVTSEYKLKNFVRKFISYKLKSYEIYQSFQQVRGGFSKWWRLVERLCTIGGLYWRTFLCSAKEKRGCIFFLIYLPQRGLCTVIIVEAGWSWYHVVHVALNQNDSKL